MQQRKVPPCCCMGAITAIPPRWVVASTYTATGELAVLNAGVVLPFFETGPSLGQCVFRCFVASPLTLAQYRRRRIASSLPDRTIQFTRTLSTGLNTTQATETVPASDGCLGDYFILRTSSTGTLPSGTGWGDYLRATCFRSLHDALLAFPSADQTCVPSLE